MVRCNIGDLRSGSWHTLQHTPLGRKIPAARHTQRRLQASVDPQVSWRKMTAINQPSIDAVRACGEHPMSLQATLIRSRYTAVHNHQVLQQQDGVTRHLSRSQRRPGMVHAVPTPRPTVGVQAATRQCMYVFCTAPAGAGSHLQEVMRVQFYDPTQKPHRSPKKTARSSIFSGCGSSATWKSRPRSWQSQGCF